MLKIKIVAITFCLLFISLPSVYAGPEVQSAQGTFAHGSTITVLGSGFGSKATAAPLIWDDCENNLDGESPTDGDWDSYRPASAPAYYNMKYHDQGFRGVNAPHSRVNRYLSGGHCESGYTSWNAGGGPNVYVGKSYPSGTENLYISFYYRLDPLWPPNNGQSVGNPNHKLFNLCTATTVDMANVHYIEYRPEIESSTAAFHSFGMDVSDYYPGEQEGRFAEEPWDWVKIELVAIDINNTSNGKLYIRTNNDLDFIRENMDVYSGSSPIRSIGIGYYWTRCNDCPTVGSNDAFRYFADVYIDTTPQRVVLANNANYDNATIIEPQIPSGWSSSGNSITCRVNLGRLSDSGTAYLFVFDANNDHNATGYPVTIGGGSAPADNPPSISITSPTSSTTYSTSENSIDIGGSASDDDGILTISWNNNRGGSGTANNDSGDYTSWSVNGLSLQDGDNIITLTARDSAGQTSSDSITVTYSSSPSTTIQAWSANQQTGDNSWGDSYVTYCARLLIEGSHITTSGSVIQLGFQGRSSGNYTIRKVSIAERDVAGAQGDVVDSSWTNVTFDGNSEATWASDVVTVPAGGEKLSNPISFLIEAGKDYYVTFKIDTPSVYLDPPSGYTELYFVTADHTDDIDWSGNGFSTIQDYHAFSSIYVVSGDGSPNPPSAPTGLMILNNQ